MCYLKAVLVKQCVKSFVLANDIIENMEAGMESFRAIMAALSKK